MLDRLYTALIDDHLSHFRQMLFLAGPRQVGKTTISKEVLSSHNSRHYYNWDVSSMRQTIVEGPESLGHVIDFTKAREHKPVITLDEIHKYRHWKQFLKGFFDLYGDQMHLIVTGSARLDLFQQGQDSLMGRYFPFLVHPLSVGECANHDLRDQLMVMPSNIGDDLFHALLTFGGFPEPLSKQNNRFLARWRSLRHKNLFQDDIRDLTQIQHISLIELLADLLMHQAGGLVKYSTLAQKVGVTINTIKTWLETLKRFYYCYLIRPWHKNISRSLLKEPKVYLWDWSSVSDQGARSENFIASHLYKSVSYWNDYGLGNFGLYFIRTKDQREVDFLVCRNDSPWFLVEVKQKDNRHISPHLAYFQEQLGAEHAFEVIIEAPYIEVDAFSYKAPVKIPAISFLSQLV